MTRSIEDANRAIAGVREMPFGLARNEVAAELAREVGGDGPAGALAFALFSLVESYAFSEEVEKAYLPFTMSVRLWDERPELFDAQDVHSLFWSFKWMVANLMGYPSVPATQIQATIEDMERRYRLAGNGLSAVNHLAFEWHRLLGDCEQAARYEAWVTTERDDFSQCPACEPGDRSTYLFEEGRYAEGIRLLENAQEAGAECRTEPADLLSQLQLAYLEVGDADGAARAHRRGLATLDTAGQMCGARGRHIQFLARSGNPGAALRFLVRYQKLLTRTESPLGRWSFLTTAGVGVGVLCADDPTTPLDLDAVPAATVGELAAWMRAQSLDLAAAFDRRGGTSATTDRTLRAWAGGHTRLPVDLTVLLTPTPLPDAAPPVPGVGTGQLGGDHGSGTGDVAGTVAGTVSDAAHDTTGHASSGQASGGHERGGQVGLGPDALMDRAEALADADPVAAARLYAQASATFAAAGEEEAAGFALAEAAVLSGRLGDLDGAAASADTALSLLLSAGTSVVYLGPVARSAARLLSSADRTARAGDVLDRVLNSVDAHLAHPGSADNGARLRVELAHLLDSRARVRASTGDDRAAVADARRAAAEFSAHHLLSDAAHANWLAGTIEQNAGRSAEAVELLESAIDAFTQVRDRDSRTEAAGLLIRALTDLGRTTDAAAVVANLAR